MEKINRRQFVATLGTLAAALPLGASAFNFVPSAGKGFEFLLLGDLHYDKLEHHDMEYIKAKFPNDISQIENYSRITRENLPLLMDVVKNKGRKLNADFYLQLGDFVEGLCGSKELARKQTSEFISFVKGYELNRPFFVIKGNHDITGEGARETYADTVIPWQSKVQKQALSTANSTFVHKNVRFVLFDCYAADESLEWLKGVLADHKEERLFFCVHQPIVPFNARANWHVFARANQQQKRDELLNLLGEHHAIVLCGHIHKTNILTRSTPKGNFVQVCIGSVIADQKSPVKDHLEGLDAYGPDLVNLEPHFSVSSLEERKAILDNEKQFIKNFEYADFCGYATANVNENHEIIISIYSNLDTEPWRIVNLTTLQES